MSSGAWRYDALERNTKMIKEFCAKYKFELRELTQYHYRIEDLIDVYPVRQKWHWLATDERGTFVNQNDLKSIILERMPEAEEENETNQPTEEELSPTHYTIEGKTYEVVAWSSVNEEGYLSALLRVIG